ncbi:MAG TPA: ribbon-helix-helix domain-containing protein [Thermoanaerobaculia bacterium]|nr:ribbon-helix-helix domain-containing protein [Thermoanaerobaculia bacterium]
MSRAVKISVSIPSEVLERADRERETMGESRSEFVRQAIEERIRRMAEAERVERYVQGYRKTPETAEEVASTFAMSRAALAGEPWE